MSNEAIPKGAARILNAAKVQAEFRTKRKSEDVGDGKHAKKRKVEQGDGAKGKDVKMKILPGESLAHFNRCVPCGSYSH